MERDAGDAGVLDQPPRQHDAVPLAGPLPGRSLTVTGRPLPSRAACAIATALSWSSSSAAPAPVLQTFLTGQPMLMSIRSAPASAALSGRDAHDVGVVSEELHRDRDARRDGSGGTRARCAGRRTSGRSSRPSPTRPARRRAASPGAGRTSCRSRRAARARPGSRSSRPPRVQGGQGAHGAQPLGRLRSQIRRRPVSVSRSSTSSIRSQCGAMIAAWPPVATAVASSPSSSRMRPRMPSTWPGEAVDEPRLERGVGGAPDRRLRRLEVDLEQPRRALGQGVERDLDARREHAAEVLAVRRDDVVVDRGAEVDRDARRPDPLVGGERVHQPVGADLVRVVHPDRHAGLEPGARPSAAAPPGSARRAARTRGSEPARPTRRSLRRCRSAAGREGRGGPPARSRSGPR